MAQLHFSRQGRGPQPHGDAARLRFLHKVFLVVEAGIAARFAWDIMKDSSVLANC
jgi:hypothetical protein